MEKNYSDHYIKMLQWEKTIPIISYGLAILINSTGISFPTDLGSGNSIPTPQIRRECLIPDEHMESILSDYINFENSSFEDEFKYNKISNDPTVRATLVEVVNKIQIMTN